MSRRAASQWDLGGARARRALSRGVVALGGALWLALALQANAAETGAAQTRVAESRAAEAAGPALGAAGSLPDTLMPPASAAAPRPAVLVPRPNATVAQPRSFGYVVGDLFTQRVLLSLNGREFVPAELPVPGRAGVWFERRAVRIDKDAQGRRWLVIDYQLLNSPQALTAITLPAWKLKSQPSAANELRIAEWPMTVAPLTPQRPIARAGLGQLRPDRAAPAVALGPMQRGFAIGLSGLLLTLAAWVSWWAWRNWRASTAQPFARALRELRNIDGTSPEAWYALHRAFDGTAGRATRAETLPALFSEAPQLQPIRPAIEAFFAQSAARFFEGKPPAQPVSAQPLARELRRIEKRYER